MDIKTKILQWVLWNNDEIQYMVSHNLLAYFWIMVITLCAIIITFFLYYVLSFFLNWIASWICGFLGVVVYIYFFLHFLDIYLDSLIITKESIIIYKWYGLFKSSTDIIELSALESVYSDQTWFVNFVFNNWDVYMRRSMYTNIFYNVHNPWHIADHINKLLRKLEYNNQYKKDNSNKEEDSDFNLFIESMAEIIRDYKKKD